MAKAKVIWTKQLGSAADDFSRGVAADSSGNVYITGGTKGNLGGTNTGGYDAWVAKYDSEGNQQWVKQLGTPGDDISWGIAVDSSDNICITGYTRGDLAGSNAGADDAWVAKYDRDGNQLWLQQLGTAGEDKAYGIATDGSGNIYIAGGTTGSLAGSNTGDYDAWVAKYDSEGNQKWLKQLGSSQEDKSWGIAASDSGNIYITGRTTGSLAGTNAGGWDAWVAKFDGQGNQLWIEQLGTPGDEYAFAIALDSSSNAYVSGCTQGGLAGSNAGGWDAWVAKYDSDGNQQWIEQLGTSEDELSWGVAVDSSGNIYATGHTKGDLAGSNAGGFDVWVAKLSEI